MSLKAKSDYNPLMRGNRLTTEELIQATRSNYDAAKVQEKNREVEIALQLRNKENQYLTSQIVSVREEFSVKNKLLESELTQLKK